jgi:hypothetical protein
MRGSSGCVVGESLTGNRRFALHKAGQQTDLLHFSVHSLTECSGPVRDSAHKHVFLILFLRAYRHSCRDLYKKPEIEDTKLNEL